MTLMVKLDVLAKGNQPRKVWWVPVADCTFMLSKSGDMVGMTLGNETDMIYASKMNEREFEAALHYAVTNDGVLLFTAHDVENQGQAVAELLRQLTSKQ